MVSAANQDAYNNPAWGTAPGGGQPWGGPGWYGGGPWHDGGAWASPPFWHPAGLSRPVGIALMVLGFIFFWPVGLAILFAMLWSGRMGCWGRRRWAGWQGAAYQDADGRGGGSWGPPPWAAWKGWCNANRAAPTSGNRAFDEYRAETLRRLEEEQKEFGAFLDRLRFAKDKAEFDAFMAERRQRSTPPAPPADEQPTG